MNACGFDRFDFYGCLDRVESAIAREIRLRIGPSDFPNTFGGMRNWAGFDFGRRARSVREAINESQSIALRNLHAKLAGISLQDIWPLLADICHDLALYLGGGAVAGAAIGAGLGFMVFGVGAIPGAVAGTAMGAKIGAMLLNFIGLKSVIEYMIDNVPLAIAEYQKGFLDAWGPVPTSYSSWSDRRPSHYYFQSTGLAAHSFTRGHEIIVVALLMGIVAYLARGKGNLQALLSEARSGRLGAKFATWLEKNAEKLSASPILQVQRKGGGQAASHDAPAGTTGQQLKKEAKQTAALEAVSELAGRPDGVLDRLPTVTVPEKASKSTIASARSGQLAELLPESSLSSRQMKIHTKLSNRGRIGSFSKRSISMSDLRAIGRVTGDEYSMFTLGSQRTVVRGYGNEISVSRGLHDDLLAGKYGRWSGHTHPPGYSVMPGPADRPFLQQMGQQRSAIWGDTGHYTFGPLPLDDVSIRSEAVRKQWERFYGGD